MTPRSEDDSGTAKDRTCPFCAESIRREAKICPRCGQWLTLRSLRNPAITVWVYGVPHLAVFAAFALLMLTSINRFQNPKPDYTDFLNSLQVTQSGMQWVESSNGPRIYITGILTNQSAIAWRDVELECRFIDADGRMVDAGHPHAGLTIQAHDDAAFRAFVTPTRGSNDYARCEVTVTTARNTKGLF